MLKTDYYTTRPDRVKLLKTYSDKGVYIEQEQTGVKYAEAIDVENSGFTYIESDVPIESESE